MEMMVELIVSMLFGCMLVYIAYRAYVKKFKNTYFAVSYYKEKNQGKTVFYISFQWSHGYYRDGRRLTQFEVFLLPKKIKKLLMKCYATEDEAYQALRHLETA